MSRRRPISLALASVAALAMVVAVIGPPGPTASEAPGAPASTDAIDAWLAHQIADAGIPGGALVIVRDGRIIHARGFGTADDTGRPVTAGTPFLIGSLSKAFTATAVMQLVDDGRVDLDRSITSYLPELSRLRPVTVRELLQQTSGIPTSAGLAPLAEPRSDLATQVRALAGVRPMGTPGSAFQYSNANYLILGRLVETVSGLDFGTYLDRFITGPLGMTTATTDHAAAMRAGLAEGHRLFFGLAQGHEAPDRPDLAPAGFIAASANDMGRWLLAQLGEAPGDHGLLDPASLTTMHQGAAPTGAGDGRYAMGWVDATLDGERIVSHVGSTTDMAAIAALVPGRRLGVAVLLDGQSPFYELLHKPDAIGLGVVALLLGRRPGGTLEALYPALDTVLAVLLVLQLRGLVRLLRKSARTTRPMTGWRGRRPVRLVAIALRAYLDVVVPVAIIVLVPSWLGAWPAVLRTDIGVVLAALVALRVADGALRLRGLGTWPLARRARREPPAVEPPALQPAVVEPSALERAVG